jgi:hypothetical protein
MLPRTSESLLVLVGSLVWLVPIQRTVQSGSELSAAALDELRTRWLRGHLIRAITGVAPFALAVVATIP